MTEELKKRIENAAKKHAEGIEGSGLHNAQAFISFEVGAEQFYREGLLRAAEIAANAPSRHDGVDIAEKIRAEAEKVGK